MNYYCVEFCTDDSDGTVLTGGERRLDLNHGEIPVRVSIILYSIVCTEWLTCIM